MKSQPVREGLALIGIAAIAYAALFFTDQTVFPGVNAAFPVLGTAALIYCAQGTLVGRVLETRVLVGIGLISYSLYLWHWPLIVAVEYYTDENLSGAMSVVVLVASFLLAILSWRYVERPFRKATRFNRRAIFRWTIVAMATGSVAALAMMTSNGWPSRFSNEVLRIESASTDVSPARGACITDAVSGERPECTLGADVPPTTLLWGDSHGVELAWALSEKLSKRGASIMQRTRGSCPPILGFITKSDPNCAAFNEAVVSAIETNPDLKTIIISGFWASGAYNSPAGNRELDATVDKLLALGRRVVVIGPIPPQKFDVPRRLAHMALREEDGGNVGVARHEFEQQTAWFENHYNRWREAGVVIVEPSKTFCDVSLCAASLHGQPLYFDSHHVSLAGARMIVASHPELWR